MKLTINSKEFLKSIQLVGACIKQKNTMPILDNLLFNISDGKLVITADNLEIRSQIEIDVEFDGELNTCIPYKLFLDILKNLPNAPIEVNFNDKNVSIKSSTGLYNVPLVEAQAFPKPKELKESQSIKLNCFEFIEALRKAILFSDRDDSFNLNNILIKIGSDNTKIVSVDNALIYEYSLEAKGEEKEIILSQEIVKYLIQSVSIDDEIELNYTDNHLLMKFDNRVITAILSQGKFPNYNSIYNSIETDKKLKIDKEVFHNALRRINAITDTLNYVIIMNLTRNQLELSFENNNLKYNAKEVLDCDYQGDDLTIGFNIKYLINMVSILDNEVEMELLNSKRPCLFFAENTKSLISPFMI